MWVMMFIVYKVTEKERVKCCLISGQIPKKYFNRPRDRPIENITAMLCSSSLFSDCLPERFLQSRAPWPIALFPPLPPPGISTAAKCLAGFSKWLTNSFPCWSSLANLKTWKIRGGEKNPSQLCFFFFFFFQNTKFACRYHISHPWLQSSYVNTRFLCLRQRLVHK